MKVHSKHFLALVTHAKATVEVVTPAEVKEMYRAKKNVILIDVREQDEWKLGHDPRAIHLSKGVIERDIEKIIPDLSTKIILHCSGGFRSILAAANLQKMGYRNVLSLENGAWQALSTHTKE